MTSPAQPTSAHLEHVGDPIDWAQVVTATGLVTVEHRVEANSTMDLARELSQHGHASLPAIVVADRQRNGRGRRGAGWWQSAGSLAVSLVVDPAALGWPAGFSPAAAGWSLACGVALAETLGRIEPSVRFGLRWPNDVEVEGRKLAGILAESMPTGRVVFGIGVNTAGSAAAAPAALRSRVVTLPDLTGRSLPRQRLLTAFLPSLWQLLAGMATDRNLLVRRYRPLCALIGRNITIHQGERTIAGRCLGIDSDGAITICDADGVQRCHAGSLSPPGHEWRPEVD